MYSARSTWGPRLRGGYSALTTPPQLRARVGAAGVVLLQASRRPSHIPILPRQPLEASAAVSPSTDPIPARPRPPLLARRSPSVT
eukprot:3481299-Pyramimonas_sp.AAC.1